MGGSHQLKCLAVHAKESSLQVLSTVECCPTNNLLRHRCGKLPWPVAYNILGL